MSERRYRVRNPDGVELEPASPDDVCALITQGEIDLEASASILGEDTFLPITQFPQFAKAFEARFGISSRVAGSDSTPRNARKPQSGPTPISLAGIEDRTLRFSPTAPLLELASRPAARKDSASFKPQELDAWTPVSNPTNAPPPAPQLAPVVPVGIADDLSPPSLRALPDPPPAPDTKIDAIPSAPRQDEDPATPITHTSPALDAVDPEPNTPVTQSGVSTVIAEVPAQVIVGDPVEDGKTTVAPPRPRVVSEIMRASPIAISVPPQLIAPPPSAPLVVEQERTLDAIGYALAAWAVLFLIFYGAGIALDLGSEEARWIPTGYYWARILLLISAGIGLSTMLLRDETVNTSRFFVSIKWTAAALVFGAIAGMVSPTQKLGAGLPVALSMGFLQVVSEEIFFRGYVDRALVRAVPGNGVPTVIAAVMYGCFQLTYGTLWLDRALPLVLLHAAAQIVLLGLPLSFLHHKTRGFVAPFVCHVVAMMVMLLAAS